MYRVGWAANCSQNLLDSIPPPAALRYPQQHTLWDKKLNSVADEVHRRLGYDALQYLRSLPPHPPVLITVVDCVWIVMAHAQKPDFVFRRNGRVLNFKLSHPRCVYINNRCGGQSITQQYLKVFNNDKSKLHVSAYVAIIRFTFESIVVFLYRVGVHLNRHGRQFSRLLVA